MKIIFIDTETTGLNPEKHTVIQIAGMIVIDGQQKELFNYRIRPIEGAEIEDSALAIQGVTREELGTFENPAIVKRAFEQIMGKYVDKFNRSDKFTPIAYNGKFDLDMLAAWFKRQGDLYFHSWVGHDLIDPLAVIRCMRLIDPDLRKLENMKLATVCRHFGIEISKEHDAMADIEATRMLTAAIIAKMKGIA